MSDEDDVHDRAKRAWNAGGLITEEVDNSIRISLAIDASNPHLIFDRLNELEISLIKSAGNDIDKVMKVSKFVDDIRSSVKNQLAELGVEVTSP